MKAISKRLVLPAPPLLLGATWTGKSLLNWILSQADQETKDVLVQMHAADGGEAFMAFFNAKAEETNRLVAEQSRLAAHVIVTDALKKARVN